MLYEVANRSKKQLSDVRLEFNSLAYLLEKRAEPWLDAKEMDDMNYGLGRILRRLCTRLRRIEETLEKELDHYPDQRPPQKPNPQ